MGTFGNAVRRSGILPPAGYRPSLDVYPSGNLSRGFTLVEVLVIVVIISIVVTVSLLSMNVIGKDTQIADETRRLEQVILAVREKGEMQGRDYGLRFHLGGYEFLRYEVRKEMWEPVADDPLLRARELPPGVQQRLILEGREVVLKERPVEEQKPQDDKKDEDDDPNKKPLPKDLPPPPQVFILGNGDLSAFELHLEREGTEHAATLIGKVDGTLEIKSVDEDKKP